MTYELGNPPILVLYQNRYLIQRDRNSRKYIEIVLNRNDIVTKYRSLLNELQREIFVENKCTKNSRSIHSIILSWSGTNKKNSIFKYKINVV